MHATAAPHTLTAAFHDVGLALRRPEALAAAFDAREGSARNPFLVPALLASAIAGVGAYGVTLALSRSAGEMLLAALQAPLAAGLSWALSLPALWVVRSFLGSRLPLRTATFAALLAVTYGSLALLASIPITWLFELALPHAAVRALLHTTILLGTGTAMADTFLRTLRALEPDGGRLFPLVWLALVALVGLELSVLFGLV